jgi:glutamate dehydrogenase (NAD(P)+)
MLGVQIHELTGTDAFVVFDLDDASPAVGRVRLARKVLFDGAELLARASTYEFAVFERTAGGASAGINAQGEDASRAIASFVDEVAPLVADGRLVLEAGKGVTPAALRPLTAADAVSPLFHQHGDALRGFTAAVSADSTCGLEGRAVAIEGFDGAGPEIARQVYDRGGRVVAISTGEGSVHQPKGFEAAVLGQAWIEHGPALVEHLDVPRAGPGSLWEVQAEVLFVGSKAGVVDHQLAGSLHCAAVVPSGPVPVTARALAVLQRNGVTVLPDFVTCGGPVFAMWSGDDATIESVRATAAVGVQGVLGEIVSATDGPFLAASHKAESFLRTWREELPFGRPLA